MGKDYAWNTLKAGVKLCHEAGLPVAFNTCLMKKDFYNGTLERIMDVAKDFNACLIQIIKPKPSGGWLAQEDIDFTPEDLAYIKAKVNQYNLRKEFSPYPSISAQIIEEDKAVFVLITEDCLM